MLNATPVKQIRPYTKALELDQIVLAGLVIASAQLSFVLVDCTTIVAMVHRRTMYQTHTSCPPHWPSVRSCTPGPPCNHRQCKSHHRCHGIVIRGQRLVHPKVPVPPQTSHSSRYSHESLPQIALSSKLHALGSMATCIAIFHTRPVVTARLGVEVARSLVVATWVGA